MTRSNGEKEPIWELMRSGSMYNDYDPVLCRRRETAAALAAEYFSCAEAERDAVLRRLFRRCGASVHLEPFFRCEFGCNISIGDFFYANYDLVILDGGEVTIGDHVLIGPKCGLYSTNHAIDPQERVAGGVYARPIRLGDRVWLGGGVTVTPGVTIGADSVIGAGSVVTKDIPAGVVAAGNPCRVIREITPADKTGFCGGEKRFY